MLSLLLCILAFGLKQSVWKSPVQAMVSEQASDSRWGAHAQKILDGSMWKPPANGGHNDKAHPPIHPTKYSAGEGNWDRDKKQLYEFIVRSFLATCSKSAVGQETRIDIKIASEAFHATGTSTAQLLSTCSINHQHPCSRAHAYVCLNLIPLLNVQRQSATPDNARCHVSQSVP